MAKKYIPPSFLIQCITNDGELIETVTMDANKAIPIIKLQHKNWLKLIGIDYVTKTELFTFTNENSKIDI